MPLPTIPYDKALPGLPRGLRPDMEGIEIRAPKALALEKASAAQGASPEPCALVELAVAVEYSMVRGLGSAAAAEKRINDIYNMVDGLYQDPAVNIHVRISEIIIETEQKYTWGSTPDINQYLSNLTGWMAGSAGFKKPFDVASLWYYSLGGGTVGLAWVGTICTNRRSNVIRYFTATTRSMMIDAAHELGHNFSAPHISNSNWLMNPSITGFNDKWDPSTIGAVVGHKKSRNCLSGCQVAPIAAFSVTGQTACSDRRTFTDLSAGEPTAWHWDFGDGANSQERSPTHTYAAPGRYKATLSASNAYGATSASRSDIRVENIPPPTAKAADGCAPASLTLEAQGTGTLRWYDSATGGAPLAVGRTFTTPQLTRARTFYVENGEPDMPTTRVGPLSNNIGPGNHFVNNSDRRLFFDAHRPVNLVSASVNAGAAGPRTIEILDARDRRLMARTVQIPAGVSRIPLGFQLPAGADYAIKVSGPGDSVNLFRNSSGASYPYVSPDTLVTITGSDAVTGDSLTEAGYYYYFYDWEIREVGCASVRVPVEAKLTCPVGLEPSSAPFAAALRPLARGRYRLEGEAPRSGNLVVTVRSLDGALIRSETRSVAAGRIAFEIDLGGNASRLMLVQLRLGGSVRQQVVHGL
jgi:PKD repeat protein